MRQQELDVSGGLGIRLSLRNENIPVGGEAMLLTDAQEPYLWIEYRSMD